MNEDYVSFEIAKLLREKGFNWEWSPFSSQQEEDEWMQNNNYNIPNPAYDESLPFDSSMHNVIAPHVTLGLAMKWLREVHHIFIQVELYSKYDNYSFELFQNTHRLIQEKIIVENSPEEAAEAAIKYCLENLL